MPNVDPVAKAEYQRAWYQRNKEKHKQRRKQRYEKNKEEVLAQCKEYYKENQKEVRERQAAYQKTPEYLEMRRAWYRKKFNLYRDRKNCRSALNNAIRKGFVVSQPCCVCGDVKSEAHHEDYSKPYDVIWLCKYHHKLLEGKIVVPREDPEQRVSGAEDAPGTSVSL